MIIRKAVLSLVLIQLTAILYAGNEYSFDTNGDGKPDKWYVMENGQPVTEKSDLNFDGVVDFVVRFNKNGEKKYEEMDNNFDGKMDNFYYYEKGNVVKQTIDSNYDGKIDIWIYLDGPYVTRYEQDTDFDGTIDNTKMFGAD